MTMTMMKTESNTSQELSIDPIEYPSKVLSLKIAQTAISSSDGAVGSPDVTAVMITLTKYIEVLGRVSKVLEQYKELVGTTATALDFIGRSFYLRDKDMANSFTISAPTAKNE